MTLRILSLYLFILILFSCNEDPKSHMEYVEGYWEIEKVTLPDGSQKEYNFNNTIDYLELTDSLQGFRKKLMPRLDGTFETSADEESFQIKIENDSLNVYYETPFNSWKETIVFANEDQMKVINTNKVQYLYKRYEPINLD